MKKNLYVFLLLAIGMAYGQDQTSNWYFGKGAGVQFNSDGSVSPLTDGKTNTEEGCASISDDSGALLFYTDGIIVYNRHHEIMLNGTGLYGDRSSTQSALIVPGPLDSNIFYIFTVDTSIREGDPDFGLNYSIVDISGDNGNGEVIQRNINLLGSCSEKIAAVVKDCFDGSIWVMTLSNSNGLLGLFDTFHAFEVNEQGVSTSAVKSTFQKKFKDQRGSLKFSSDGTKIASANEFDGLFVYDFNPRTGMVSNPEKITVGAVNKNPYGIEFSPSNQFLYVHAHSDTPPLERGHTSNLLQYDLFSPDISDSEVVLDERSIYRGALQLGANGKIYRTITETYRTGTQQLGVINDPDQKGTAANYEHNAIFLDGGIGMQGLPPFVQTFFAKKGLFKNTDGSTSTAGTVCEGTGLVLETDPLPNAIYEWEHNGIPFNNPDGHFLRIEEARQENEGQYRLIITPDEVGKCAILNEAQIQVFSPPPANNVILTQCDIDEGTINASSDGYTAFNLEQAKDEITPTPSNTVSFYETLTDLANDNPIEDPSRYLNSTAVNQLLYTKVTDSNGCTNTSELLLEVSPSLQNLSTGQKYYACDIDPLDTILEGIFDLDMIRSQSYADFEVFFYASRNDAALEINPIELDDYISVSTSIFARIESMNQCLGVEEFDLVVLETPALTIASEFMVCTDNPELLIVAEGGYDIYHWYLIETSGRETLISDNQSANILEVGEYRLEVGWSYNNGELTCSDSKNFTVVPSNAAIITNIEIEDLQEDNQVSILVTGDGDYEYALGDIAGPYQENSVIRDVPPGHTTIYVRDKNGCGITEEEISIIGFPKFFTPNADGINELWNLIGVPLEQEISVFIYDRFGILVAQITPDSSGWDGQYDGQPLPASDYWFKIPLANGKEFVGHFALKR